jgi:hypothetical protein
MTRPYKMTSDRGLQPDMASVLYVKRDGQYDSVWRLAWMVPGENCYCYAEGECSAKYHRTRRDAIAWGERHYGETARWWI